MELRQASQAPGFPQVVLVFRGDVERGREVLSRVWPEVRAIADLTGELYSAFGVKQGTLRTLFGLAVFAAFWRAVRKGHGVGRASADPTREPGLFLIDRGQIVWRHEFRHVGDHPDFAQLIRVVPAR